VTSSPRPVRSWWSASDGFSHQHPLAIEKALSGRQQKMLAAIAAPVVTSFK
jgi:hypothetical protein